MSRASLVIVIAAGLIACGQAIAPANTNAINVSGVLDRGPVARCPTGEPCDPPATATYLVFSRAGHLDIRVFVAPGGTFALHLDPGGYSIAAAPPPLSGKLTPDRIKVPAQGDITLVLSIG